MAAQTAIAVVEYLAKALVDDPEAVEVTEDSENGVIELKVAPDDRGKVIGKKGRTAHAIRALLTALNEAEPLSLEIVD
jgi:uncharacterized protein